VTVRIVYKLFVPPIVGIIFGNFPKILRKRYSGYQDTKLVEVIIQKNIQFRRDINKSLDFAAFRITTAIGLLGNQKTLRVLDFGGGGGHHHATAQHIFPEIDFYWKVIETPALVREASDKLRISNLTFSDQITGDKILNTPIDLIHSNSAIQYTDNPTETINLLKKLDFKYIYLTRIPLAIDSESFEYMQTSRLFSNGPGYAPKGIKDALVEYKARIMDYEGFKRIISTDCTLVFELNEGPWDSNQFGEKVGTFTFALRKM
jgi:putative methyltransferase (TIGR04325 family)